MTSLPRSTAALVTVALASLALAAPLASAAGPKPGYNPDYPQYCLNEQEDPPGNLSNPYGTGSYHCTGAIWTKCNGIQYSTPCKICQQYDYTYGPPDSSQPPKPSVGKHHYHNCVRLPGISISSILPQGGPEPVYVEPALLGPTYSEVVED